MERTSQAKLLPLHYILLTFYHPSLPPVLLFRVGRYSLATIKGKWPEKGIKVIEKEAVKIGRSTVDFDDPSSDGSLSYPGYSLFLRLSLRQSPLSIFFFSSPLFCRPFYFLYLHPSPSQLLHSWC